MTYDSSVGHFLLLVDSQAGAGEGELDDEDESHYDHVDEQLDLGLFDGAHQTWKHMYWTYCNAYNVLQFCNYCPSVRTVIGCLYCPTVCTVNSCLYCPTVCTVNGCL